MITLAIGDGTVSVEYDGMERDEYGYRRRYTYSVAANGWQYVGNDLCSGVGSPVDESAAMGTLLSFLSAYADARDYGPDSEDINLFPGYVGEWVDTARFDIESAAIDYP